MLEMVFQTLLWKCGSKLFHRHCQVVVGRIASQSIVNLSTIILLLIMSVGILYFKVEILIWFRYSLQVVWTFTFRIVLDKWLEVSIINVYEQ